MDNHYEVWGGWNDDSAHGAEAEFLETCTSIDEARTARDDYRKSSVRYAYIRDMNKNGEIVN